MHASGASRSDMVHSRTSADRAVVGSLQQTFSLENVIESMKAIANAPFSEL